MSLSNIHLHLTGGLGNQLFQLAAAASRSELPLHIESTLGKPRLNTNGKPDFSDFYFPFKFEHLINSNTSTYKYFMSKTAGYILRQGLDPRGVEQNRLFCWITKMLASLVLSIGFRKSISVVQATDNGYCNLPKPKKNEYLVGYFQSYRWHDVLKSNESFNGIRLIKPSNQYLEFLSSLKEKSNIMVHIRLGDYLNEPTFGVPGPKYYEVALTEILKDRDFDSIILFSNDPQAGLEIMPTAFRSKVIIAPDFSGSAAETLEAMRNMNAYVIGNSSLSWWAATLRYDKSAQVYCPAPWFRHKKEPTDLIPSEWNRIKGWPDE
jgi:hypothetical protein